MKTEEQIREVMDALAVGVAINEDGYCGARILSTFNEALRWVVEDAPLPSGLQEFVDNFKLLEQFEDDR